MTEEVQGDGDDVVSPLLRDLVRAHLILGDWLTLAWDLKEMLRVRDTELEQAFDLIFPVFIATDALTIGVDQVPEALGLITEATNRLIPIVSEFVRELIEVELKTCDLYAETQGLPEFTDIGYLPPGLHIASWREFAERYGTNKGRQSRINTTLVMLNLLKQGGATTARIGGSFVTAKDAPTDIDIYWSGKINHKIDIMLLQGWDTFGVRHNMFGTDLHFLEEPDSLLGNYTRFSARHWKTTSDSRGSALYQDRSDNTDPFLKQLLSVMPQRRRVGAVVLALDNKLPFADMVEPKDMFDVRGTREGIAKMSVSALASSPFMKRLAANLI